LLLTDLNLLLKQIIVQLVQSGFKLTSVGKVLLGANSYTPILKLTEEESTSFGYKPLAKIGRLLHKDLYLVYLDENDELRQIIEQKNTETMYLLKEKISNYLNGKETLDANTNLVSSDKLNQILSSILGDDGPELE
jgi:hypothetical protein